MSAMLPDWLSNAQTPFGTILLRLVLAVLLSAALGLDRELRNKPAGLRTHMLVALAAATFTIITVELVQAFSRIGSSEVVRTDPIRIIEAVISGVAFLGAGTIIQSRGSIKGVTTGASIWLVGAIGLACGAGLYGIAGLATLLGLCIVTLLGAIEGRMERPDRGPR